MSSVGLAMELEDRYEGVALLNIKLLLWNALGNNIPEIVDTNNRIAPVKFPEEPVVVGFIDSDGAAFLLAWDLGFLDQLLNEILDLTTLGHQNIELILYDRAG